VPTPCSEVSWLINAGAAGLCPNNNCGPTFNGSEWQFLHFTDDGMGYGQLNEYAHAQRPTKPKLKPAKNRTPKQRERAKRKAQETRRRDVNKGNSEDDGRNNIHVIDFMSWINQHLTIEHFAAEEESWIRYELQSILSERCSQAFATAHVRSPTATILQLGLTVRPARDLFNYSAGQLGLSQESLIDSQNKIYSGPGGTVFGTDGGAQIYLTPEAFHGGTWFYFSLGEVLAHELIHGGGQGPWPADKIRHDLSGFPAYKSIIDACRH
jgi:hypothetical protein